MKIPNLRFPEFKVEWKEKYLGKTCVIKTGNRDTQNRISNGLYPFYVRSNTVERINSFSYDGEAILTSGDGVGVGKNFHYVNGKFDYHQRVYCLQQFEKDCSGSFIYHVFAGKFNKRVTRLSAKNSVDSVRMDMISQMSISFPSLEEQQKIASFLTAVDEKINLLQKKKQGLEQYKKGVMQQLFSQKLRFKKEDGSDFPDWEKKKLGDLCSIKTGKLDANAMVENGDYRFYTCAKDYYRIDQYAFDTEALLISGNGANVGYIHYYKGKFNAYQRTYVLDSFDQDIQYIKYFLDKNLYERIRNEKKEGNTPYIVLGTLKEMVIAVPNLMEQTKISNFLNNIDNKITFVETQLGNTKQFKKGLLQQMFV